MAAFEPFATRLLKRDWRFYFIVKNSTYLIVRIGAASHPIPYQKDLELATLPGAAEIAAAVRVLYET